MATCIMGCAPGAECDRNRLHTLYYRFNIVPFTRVKHRAKQEKKPLMKLMDKHVKQE